MSNETLGLKEAKDLVEAALATHSGSVPIPKIALIKLLRDVHAKAYAAGATDGLNSPARGSAQYDRGYSDGVSFCRADIQRIQGKLEVYREINDRLVQKLIEEAR